MQLPPMPLKPVLVNLTRTGPKHGCMCRTDQPFVTLPDRVLTQQGHTNLLLASVSLMEHSKAGSLLSAEYPALLAQALASIIRPFLTTGHQVIHAADWQSILPKQLSWPDPPGRIEDGGGLPSTALHMTPQRHDKLAALRSRWFRRLSDSRQCLKITAALLSGCKEPPLSESELKPYLDDILEILDHQVTFSWTFHRANPFV